MQYALLGNTGLIVSRLSFGAMTFTAGNKSLASVYKTEAEEASAMVGRALDAGINFFDTADGYAGGESEVMLGKALKPHRQQVILTTKIGFRTGKAVTDQGLSRHHILQGIDASLQRLGTDYIDVYIAHRQDPYTPLEATLQALDEVVRSGKVRYLGFSNWPAWKVAAAAELQKANGWAPFTHGQMCYSLLVRDVEQDVIPALQHYKMGLTVWSPLAQGFLTGKYTRENIKEGDTRIGGFDFLPFDKEKGFQLVDQMKAIAAGHNATVAQVALAWLLAKQPVTSIILGASRISQLEGNLGAVEVQLTGEEIAILDAATTPTPVYPHWFANITKDSDAAIALGY